MPKQLFTNNASTVLITGINTTFTTLNVDNGSKFPVPTAGDYFNLALIGLNTNGQEASWEIVQCTARTGNVLTVTRGQESTVGTAWGVGTRVELRLTAGFSNTVSSHINNVSNPHSVTKAQVGLGNADNTADADKPVSTLQAAAIAAVVYTHPTNHPASIITQDASNRFVTDAEKTAWNAKQAAGNYATGGGTATGTNTGDQDLSGKQNVLVSGTSIKTVNSTSLLGSGNIVTGDVTLAGVQTLTNKTLTGYTETVYNLAGTVIDVANGSIQTKTLAANTTFTESLADGQSVVLGITAGAFSVTWPSVTWSKVGGSGVAPTLTSTGVNWIVLWQVGGVLRGAFMGTA